MTLNEDDENGIAAGDSTRPATIQKCRELWDGLVSGRLKIVESQVGFSTSRLLLHETSDPPSVRVLSGRSLRMLEEFLLGVDRKAISSDLGISTSALAQSLRQSLLVLGLDCTPARAPALLAMLVHAARGAGNQRLSISRVPEHPNFVALSGETQRKAWGVLSAAERAVLELRASGQSHAAIAAHRQTSRRTVANQLAAATHRLGVSGRFDLLRLMATAR